ncbi:MAG: hybrid sensor histidine kinase/response regulator [Candidatus Rokuibacteriota bacterium]|nr:MAG: hybrid sensor histidine kinase/response regulator [Candidatus Rokubacteria bacterium]
MPEAVSPVAVLTARPTLAAEIIIANAPDPVFVCDLEGKILEANEAVSRLLGLRRDEVLEQSISRFLGQDEAREFVVALREVVERDVTRNVRLQPRSASGEMIPTTLNASALRDTDGSIIGAIGILRDMRELDQARAYAESLIKNAPDPVFVSDLEGKIHQANDAVFSLLGFRPDELIEQSLSRIISPEETWEFMVALREVVDRGVTRNARLHPRSASGAVIPTTLNASALRDTDGRVIGAIGILRDMRELDKARAYAESLIKNAPDPVFVSDLEGKILQANDAVSHLLGFRQDEVVEQSVSRFLGADETREFVAALREVVEHGVSRNVRLHPRSASGEVISTTLNASALRDAYGNVIGAIGILRDMRAYEQVLHDLEDSRRELRDADQAKDRFLAIVSHELRTPLTAMLGWVRLLTTGRLDDATSARALPVIERNTKLLAQLIDDLLDVSGIIAGKLRLEVGPVDLVAVIESAIEAVQGLADAKSIGLKAVLDPSAGSVAGDPGRLQQVVWNLLANAIKFTPNRGRIDLRLERAGAHARLTVRDTGRGISPELLPHIFDRFRQDERTRQHGGLGLGLAIVRHIVKLHEGNVWAESEGEGRGATLVVELPLPIDDVHSAPKTATVYRRLESASSRLINLAGRRILVVDDEADARDLLAQILGQAGADVIVAGSADEALETLRRWRPDVLVSDIGMPGDDGYVLIRKVRALGAGEGGQVRALALTAYARSEDRALALEAGFHTHIAKPVDPLELTALIAGLAPERRD